MYLYLYLYLSVCLCVGVCASVTHSQTHVGIPPSCPFFLSFLFLFFFFVYSTRSWSTNAGVYVYVCVYIYIQKTTQQGHSTLCNEENSWCLCSSWVLISNDDCKEFLFFFFCFRFGKKNTKSGFHLLSLPTPNVPYVFSTQTHTDTQTPPLNSALFFSFVLLFAFSYFCVSHCRAKYRKQNKIENKEEEIDSTFASKFQLLCFFVDIDMVNWKWRIKIKNRWTKLQLL